MEKKTMALTLVFLFGFALIAATTADAAESMSKGYRRAYEAREIIGSPIRNDQGQYLGRIDDLVLDSNGRVDFAVLAEPGILGIRGKRMAVPFSALTYDPVKNHLVLKISKERLETAPVFDSKNIADRRWTQDIYRFYGQQPYWTEEGTANPAAEKPAKGKGSRDLQNLPENYYPY
jgi:sporulation protein YlmC with PRC-barrel domain